MSSPIRMVSTHNIALDSYNRQTDRNNQEQDRQEKRRLEDIADNAQRAYVSGMQLPDHESAQPRVSAIRNVAAQPGGGAVAMQLANKEQGDDKSFSDTMHALLKSNDPNDLLRAKQMSQQRGGVLPDEVIDNAKLRSEFVGMLDTGKSMGFNSPEQFKPLMQAFFQKHQGTSLPGPQMVAENIQNVPEKRSVHGTYRGDDGSIGVIESGYGGARARNLGVKGTVSGRGAGGAGGRGFEFQAKIDQGVKIGIPEDIMTKAVVLRQIITPAEISRIALNLMKMENENYEPMYPNPQDAYAKASELAQDLRVYAAQATAPQLPPGLPPGSRQIDTSNGIPVYETPTGERYW